MSEPNFEYNIDEDEPIDEPIDEPNDEVVYVPVFQSYPRRPP